MLAAGRQAPEDQRKAMFEDVAKLPVDALVEVGALLRADQRDALIDLGVGVYRDHAGQTLVPAVVKAAERLLVETQTTKSYVAPDGDPIFAALLRSVILGAAFEPDRQRRIVCAQAPGGTGALRLAMDCIAHARPGTTAWLGAPGWPNHAPMLAAAGLRIQTYRYYDPTTATLDFTSTADALERAQPGDIALLHGCCHNPSGVDPDPAQWVDLAAIIERRGLIPLIDMAYQGLGEGIEQDAAGVRLLLDRVPEALVASSCSKSFGLYRERTGLLIILTSSAQAAAKVRSNIQSLARLNYSNPPDHGAAIVRTILESEQLTREWRTGLDGMRRRITDVRSRLAEEEPADLDLSFIARQKGLFALLPLDPETIEALRRDHGVYMTRSGRINLAGLNDQTLPRFVTALDHVLRHGRPAASRSGGRLACRWEQRA